MTPSLETIVGATADYYGISEALIYSGLRQHRFAHPRQIAMYVSVAVAGYSRSETGRHFKRDHTTVIHAMRQVPPRLFKQDRAEDVLRIAERVGLIEGVDATYSAKPQGKPSSTAQEAAMRRAWMSSARNTTLPGVRS